MSKKIENYEKRKNVVNGKEYLYNYFLMKKLNIHDHLYEISVIWKDGENLTFQNFSFNTIPRSDKPNTILVVFHFAHPQEFHQYIKMIVEFDTFCIWGADDGGTDAGVILSDDKKGWDFEFFEDRVTLSIPDGIDLFYNYFKAFEIYVDQYLDEKHQKEDWYIKFKQELPKLEKLYKKLVEKFGVKESEK